jgi:hypothetical protein
MKRNLPFKFSIVFALTACMWSSCSEDESSPTFPLSAEVFYSTAGKQVAFQGLTHSAVSWNWDFGDGTTSTEQNPVHVYEEGGYYRVSLTAKDSKGGTVEKEVKLPPIDLPPYAYLVGDHTADDYQGKKWKLTSSHSAGGDYFANADAGLSLYDDTPQPLPDGIFNTEFGMGDIYKDEFTFFEDGRYVHDVKEDGGSFGGIVYEYVENGGAGIVNANGQDYGLCIAEYTPEADATFTFNENEDFEVSSVYGANGKVTYKNVMTLDFSGTEFIGFRDFQRKVIVKSISGDRMQLVMFMAAGDGDSAPIGINTHALVLSFESVE